MSALVMWVMLLLTLPSWAGEVYRCQAAEGVVYQGVRCVGAGTPLVLQVHRPSEADVARSERRVAEVRQFLAAAEQARLDAAREAASRAPVEPRPAPVVQRVERTRVVLVSGGRVGRIIGRNRHPVDICPLGLSHCTKVRGRVFRRPKAFFRLDQPPSGSRGRLGGLFVRLTGGAMRASLVLNPR